MRRPKRGMFGVVLAMVVFASVAMAAAQERMTTLLPVRSESAPPRRDGMLAITADDSRPIKSTSQACLLFDLSTIPEDAHITKTTLRLVGKPGAYQNPQVVQIFPESQKEPVGYWFASCAPTCDSIFVFSASGEDLLKVVMAALKKKDPKVSLTLSSTSRLGDWRYYSLTAYDDTSSFKPRLIIEYDLPGRSPEQQERMRTDRTHWKFFPTVTEVKVKPIMGHTTLISNPVFYRGGLYLFGSPTSESTYLYGLHSSGSERWKRAIKGVVSEVSVTRGGTGYTSAPAIQFTGGGGSGAEAVAVIKDGAVARIVITDGGAGYTSAPTVTVTGGGGSGAEASAVIRPDTPASHALVTDTGRLYSVGEDRIALYDLDKEGEPIRHVPIRDLKISVPPTLGADGSLYMVPSGYGSIYGLNPNLEELWRYPSDAGEQKVKEITPFVLGPGRQEYGYAARGTGKKNELVRINTADGSVERQEFSEKFTDFHRPLVSKGPEQDYVLLGAYSVEDGLLACYSGGKEIWARGGPVSRPNQDSQGNKVLVVQNGRLRAYDKLNGAELCSTDEETPLEATSNLVLDGEDRIYFWNNGILYGYTSNCTRFLSQTIKDLPERLELLFGHDGTLVARTEGRRLYAITPSQPSLTLDQDIVHTDTIYSADTIRVANDLQLAEATTIMLKARDAIRFGTGFTVKKGARLICKTGF
jgi:hypothetical protein